MQHGARSLNPRILSYVQSAAVYVIDASGTQEAWAEHHKFWPILMFLCFT